MEKKTKKVAVIWFGEVPEDARNAALSWGIGTGSGGVLDIELIDIDRLSYGVPKKGDKILGKPATLGLYTCLSNFQPDLIRLIIDPPKPKPETLQGVLKDRPSPTSYTSKARFVEAYKVWDKRLEAVEAVKDA